MNEDLVKAVEIVVAQAVEKATAHTLAELARVQAERDTAQAERDQFAALLAKTQAEAIGALDAAHAEIDRHMAQLGTTIAVRRNLILNSLRTHFADKVIAVRTRACGDLEIGPDEIDALLRDLANNATQAAFMLDEAMPAADVAAHSPRTFDEAARVASCACGLRFAGTDPDGEYAAHVARIKASGGTVRL